MLANLQVNNWQWMAFPRQLHVFSHAINDGSAGGGSGNYPQNVSCRSCEKGNSATTMSEMYLRPNFAYQIPFARNRWYGGWGFGVAQQHARGGLPLNVTVSRAASTLPDGNALSAQRPNIVPGVPLYLNYGRDRLVAESSGVLGACARAPGGTWYAMSCAHPVFSR